MEPAACLHLNALRPFFPGKSLTYCVEEYQLSRIIQLDSNENPRGPAPSVLRAMERILGQTNRYPDPGAELLKKKLSDFYRTSPKQLAIGNGSNEIIDLLIRAFCEPADSILISKAAFIAYRMCAQQQNIKVEEVAMGDGCRADLPALAEQAKRSPQVKIIFLANPNNPTGTFHTRSEVRCFLEEVRGIRGGSVLVVLDHAYGEYVQAPDCDDPVLHLNEFNHVVVLKTFSKAYGLAGLRIGYALGSPPVIEAIEKVRQPYHVNTLAQTAALAALADPSYVYESKRLNAEGMSFWEANLKRLGIPFTPSQGNFILIDTELGLGLCGMEVFEACLTKGIAFRPVANYGLPEMLRVSIGLPEENRVGMQALQSLIRRP